MITPIISTHIPGRTSRGGVSDIVGALNMVFRRLEEDIIPEVTVEALKPTLELANYYVPKDTGELRDSGYVEAKGKTAEIGYGKNGRAPYAVFVHENPMFYHEPPTQAKFLQRAMDEDMGSIIGRVFKGIKSRMRT